MPPISVLMKPASGLCNMYCDYCFYRDETQHRAEYSHSFMSEETLKNIIRRTLLRAEGIASYAFQGGEPTLRGLDFFRKVIEYEQQYQRNGIKIHNAIQTNGMLLNDEWCIFLKKNNFLVGLSVDGIRETHDAHRRFSENESAFDRAIAAARLMDQYGVDYNILTVVNFDVAEQIERIYKFYNERGWRYQQYIACLDPIGKRGQKSYSLTPEEYGRFLIRLFKLWYQDFLHKREPYIRQFENYIGILNGMVPEACDQRGICGIQYVVEANGDVYPCDFYMLDDYKLGNFNTDRIDAIDARRSEIEFVEHSMRLEDSCRNCAYHFICRGGCMRNRELASAGQYQNYFCKSYLQFFDVCFPSLKECAKQIRNG